MHLSEIDTTTWIPFEMSLHNGQVVYQLGMNQFNKCDVRQIAERLSTMSLDGVEFISRCGSVLTFETNIVDTDYQEALRTGIIDTLILEVLRPTMITMITTTCPYKRPETWFPFVEPEAALPDNVVSVPFAFAGSR